MNTEINSNVIYLQLAVTDVDVVAALNEHSDMEKRSEFALACMKIGVLSQRAAKGLVDGAAIRDAGDHLIGQLTERMTAYRSALEENVANTLSRYFEPNSGVFSMRVESLVKDDGDLSRVIRGQLVESQQEMGRTFETFLGENSKFLSLLAPSEENQLLSAMRQTVDDVMQAEKAVILSQFSLDQPDSALSRMIRELTASHGALTTALASQMNSVVGEFSLDRPDSALSRLVGRVETAQKSITKEFSLDNSDSALTRLRNEMHQQLSGMSDAQSVFQREVVGLLSAMSAKKTAEAKSTTHGAVFEEAVGDKLRALGVPAGDIVEDCGTTTGTIRNSKVGDFVVTLPPDSAAAGARIVIEAKESNSYSMKSTLDEADEARRNRGAAVCLFVHSTRTAPSGIEQLSRFGNDVVITWNPDDSASDLVFKAGYLTAKAISIRTAQRSGKEAASFQVIEKAIESIRKSVSGFDEMKTTSESIQNGAIKMLDRVRIMRTDLERQIETLSDHVGGLKEAAEAA